MVELLDLRWKNSLGNGWWLHGDNEVMLGKNRSWQVPNKNLVNNGTISKTSLTSKEIAKSVGFNVLRKLDLGNE